MKTVLLVDDEYAFVESVSELLQDEGYRVVSASNGRDGLERFHAENPDLVLTDLMMPIADGCELVRGIRATPGRERVPVILLTATTRAVSLADGDRPLEVAATLRKPVAWKSLLRTITELIGPGDARRGTV